MRVNRVAVEELRRMHEKHLLPGFDDRKDEEQAIEIMTKAITSVLLSA